MWTKLPNKSNTYSAALVKHIIEAGLNKAPEKPHLPRNEANLLSKSESAVVPKAEFVTVDENSDGQRLDNFLIRQLKGVPKTHVYRIIRSGEVRVNKGRASADTRVAEGDVVRLPPVRVSERMAEKTVAMSQEMAKLGLTSVAENAADAKKISKTSILKDFPILLEDEHLLAISKPAGVAVHGGSGISFGVIEQLRMVRPQAKFLELVHRLDRETSGILLVAKKRSALTNLQNQFRERETGKTYLALVVGAWPANKKVLDKPLHKYLLPTKDGSEGERRVKVTSKDDPEGMKSVTLVKIKQTLTVRPELVEGWGKSSTGSDRTGIFTLLEVTIKTGRTHQIRVHLASEGHPIAGDDKYGDFELNKALQKPSKSQNLSQTTALKRMFLHAWRLQLTHPSTTERVELQNELPAELQSFVDSLN
jgi:23S rRNA pseudouridine955/2504/2580 synthase